ncbi:efflux RND transporter permease subunit [Methylomonas sp. HYX-M1]|uniref:efflux RND transporter permease subunit n=1 Tax=Methylomonas sp. HYX-M1 TaxID=3139307 RepID=UPI00345B94C1
MTSAEPVKPFSGVLAWFAGNPVAANLLMLLILAGGMIGLRSVDKEVFPRFSPHQIEVKAEFPGAGPAEIEQSVCIPIEEALHDLPGIKRVRGTIFAQLCKVEVEILPGRDRDQMLALIRGRIQAILRLPKELETIEVALSGREGDDGVIWVALHGDTDAFELQQFGEGIQQQLAAIPGVSRVRNYGEIGYEIGIEVSPERLRKYRLSLGEVAQAVRAASVDAPGGLIKNPDGELLLRVHARARSADALRDLVLKTLPDGNHLRLAQVATIHDGLEERLFTWRHNGQTAQGWEVHTESDSVQVARQVKATVESIRAGLPEGLRLICWWDDSQAYDERIATLSEDALGGFVLVCLVLTLFLRARVALWAGVGILTSVLGAFCLMPLLDVSLNMLSLFGFLLAMGVLVDDAIIIGESIHSRQAEAGEAPLLAAVNGVKAVALPVTLSVLVVLVAFLPGLNLPGWAGQMMKPICVIMILTLLFSVIEALLILPAHLVAPIRQDAAPTRLQRLRARLNRGLDDFVVNIYRPLLEVALDWRYLTVALFAALLILSWALVAGDRVRQSINPDVTKDSFWVSMQMPQSTSYAEMQALAGRVEQALFELRAEWDAKLAGSGRGSLGEQGIIVGVETMVWEHMGGIWLELSALGRQHVQVEPFIRDWRQRIGDLGQGKVDFIFKEGDQAYDIELTLGADRPELLTAAAAELERSIKAYPGVYDVVDSAESGKPEIHLQLKPGAERLGLRLEPLAQQVRHAYYGQEVHRFIRGRKEVKVIVRYPLEHRRSLEQLHNLPVTLPNGSSAPLSSVAEVALVQGNARISREDRQRVLSIQARVDPTLGDANALYAVLEKQWLPALETQFPGLSARTGQQRQEQQAMLAAFGEHTVLALLLIYVLIAVPFRSYSKPLIFLLAAPVAWSGGVLAHWAFGLPLSMESLVGMVAASGVVVNDSLVLLDHLRQHDAGGKSTEQMIVEACTLRFRPIFLAFLTNFAGFLPTLLETSPQAQFLVPMTLSLSAGLFVGMAASLILTPVCYAALGAGGKPAAKIAEVRP